MNEMEADAPNEERKQRGGLHSPAGTAIIGAVSALLGVLLASILAGRDHEDERRHVESLEQGRLLREVQALELRTLSDLVQDLHLVPNLYVAYASHAVAVTKSKAAEVKAPSAEARAFYHRELEWAREQHWRAHEVYVEAHARLRGRLSVGRALFVGTGKLSAEAWTPCSRAWEQPVLIDPGFLSADAQGRSAAALPGWMTEQMDEFNSAGREELTKTFIECAKKLDSVITRYTSTRPGGPP